MDTSETYIRMCDCPEIQEYRPYWLFKKWFGKDIVGMSRNGYVITNAEGEIFASYPLVFTNRKEVKGIIWLPTQDRLQEMIEFPCGTFKDNFWSALDDLHKYSFTEDWMEWIPTSMEQLWLAFVMHEKFGKSWNGDKWV